jgi:IS605 OrfB family transposase
MKATESLHLSRTLLKKNKKTSCPKSKLCSIRLDSQSHSVWFDKNEVSILTIQGRVKGIKFQSYEYFNQFRTWKRKSADLIYRKDKILLTFIFEKIIPDTEYNSETFVGIDRGIRRIAVTSNKKFFGGGIVKTVSHRYQRLRANLQSCGSRSAKRHLQKISQKENRFRKDVNHCISKKIALELPVGSTIVIEDLKYIHERCRQRKKQQGELNSWSFYQLEQFLIYKANARSCRVVHVDPRYTSQKCSKCGHTSRSNRQNQTQFKCIHCGYSLNADLNASFNIRNNYLDSIRHPSRASVNRPIVSSYVPGSAGDLVTSHASCEYGS